MINYFVSIWWTLMCLYLTILSIVTLSFANEMMKTSIGTNYIEPIEPESSSYSLNCMFPTAPNVINEIDNSLPNITTNSLKSLPKSVPTYSSTTTTTTSSPLPLVNPSSLFQPGTCQWNFTGFTYSVLPDSSLNEYALYSKLKSTSEYDENTIDLVSSMSTPWINGSSIAYDSCKMYIEYRIINSLDPFDVVIDSQNNVGSTIITEMRYNSNYDNEWLTKTIPLFKTQPNGPFRVMLELPKLRPRDLNELDLTYAAIRRIEFISCFNSERKSIDPDRCYYECDGDLSLIDTPNANWYRINSTQCIERSQMCNLINECSNGQDENYNCNLIPSIAKSTFNCNSSDLTNDICGWSNCKFISGTYHNIHIKSLNDTHRWILNSNRDENYIEAQFTSTANKYSDLARIKSPNYPPIPFYHSNDTSKYFNSCQLTFKYLITKTSVSLAVRFVSPDITLEQSTHQSLLLSTLEKSIGSFKHPFKRSPNIWDLFSIFKGQTKSTTSHKSNSYEFNNHQNQNQNNNYHLHHRWSHVTVPLPMFVHSSYFIVIEATSGYSSGKLHLTNSKTGYTISSSIESSSIIAVTNITLSKECFAIDVPKSEGIIHPYVKSYTILYVTLTMIIFILLTISILALIYLYKKNKFTNSRSNYMSNGSEINELRSVTQMGPGSTSTVTSRFAVNATYYACNSASPVTDLTNISHDQVICERKLGNGAFGEVFAGKLKCDLGGDLKAGFPIAIKTLHEHSDSYQAEMDFTIEAQIMAKFNHRNIVRFIGVCFDAMPRMIILEFLEGKDVKEFLRKSRGTSTKPCLLNMGDLLVMALDVARGCEYLEAKHFIHRDIAARNCLLNRRHKVTSSLNKPYPNTNGIFNLNNYDSGFNGSGLITKIADFGMARDIYRADYYKKGGKAMIPVKWMPPECFLEGIFTSKTDVWAYGIFLWEVFSMGFMPYPGHSNHEVMELVQRNERMKPPNSSTPGPVYALMLRCWQAVPDMRPSFSEIIRSIGLCLVDPDIHKMPLPVFSASGTGYCFDDQAIMRPPPDSTDYLVPSHTCSNSASNYSMSTEKTELLSPDSVSIRQSDEGRLVELDESIGGITVMNSRAPPPLPFSITSSGNCILPTTPITTTNTSTNGNNGQVILDTNLITPSSNCSSNIIIDTSTTRPSSICPLVSSITDTQSRIPVTVNSIMLLSSSSSPNTSTASVKTTTATSSSSSSSTVPAATTTTTSNNASIHTSNNSSSHHLHHHIDSSNLDQLNASSLLSSTPSSSTFTSNINVNSSSPSSNTTNRTNSPNRYVNV